ncbi:MAG: hypothetical protein O8C61_05575 [Candidatus Methanoperedens sp.]|nr:hypothetical protein [Candidatus Methanoperedens sp.]
MNSLDPPNLYVPLNLHAVCGLPRKGKTALVVLMALEAHERGALIYSNVKVTDINRNDIRAPDGRLDPDDPNVCLHQLDEIFQDIRDNETWNIERFLILDEFSSLADAQDWKKYTWTTQLWKQAGKIGITGVAMDQNFSRIYNGYRDITVYKFLVGDVDINGDYVSPPFCSVMVGRQTVNDHAEYTRIADFYVDLTPAFKCYNTHQLMYFGQKKKKTR